MHLLLPGYPALLTRWAVLVAVAVGGIGGCQQDHEFVGEGGFYAFAMTEQTPAAVQAEDAALFLVETRVELPLIPPTEEEMAELMAQAPAPFARQPWIALGDLALELDVVVKNLMDEPRRITVTINGFNEFHEYQPTFVADDDEIIAEFSSWERSVELESSGAFSWTVDERELDEVAIDLATVANGAPNPQHTIHFENQSGRDPQSDPHVPGVIPGLTGFRLGLSANGASNIVLEASLRVRDQEGRLVGEDEEPWELPVPEILSSGAAMGTAP